jgi:undecaprenol kinase/diacylglycerol kinase (ATP)
LVSILGVVLKINANEWISLVLIVTIVLILELINTAIETVVDMISLKFHPLAKIAKDVTAGAVLVASIGAIVVGVMIFLPKLLLVVI